MNVKEGIEQIYTLVKTAKEYHLALECLRELRQIELEEEVPTSSWQG